MRHAAGGALEELDFVGLLVAVAVEVTPQVVQFLGIVARPPGSEALFAPERHAGRRVPDPELGGSRRGERLDAAVGEPFIEHEVA